ncbi:Zn2/Cys6 DNA-binding protein [Glarea lozoyensis ATCC 20868]|uniref:Zn2/Cys6 DNA-binding protein n=1 Tax=Glarea lozoyensis (strain ATCC 20868 / MF5171) TaxID=1116229 RepID=S3CL92_GLAL2|nr:Zn2/Cys6 DNA-binding protein [Glarea lozoyensis ATCC 20868]EPE27262.1 Zn2/Cys6 DNA-binding protein [Glarea lozoyensis ATCC 20868]
MSVAEGRERQDSGEPPRKRVRKGTRSCWECKRRKVKCQLSSEDVPVCSGCLARGTTCLSQEYPEEREPSNNAQVGERLGRVEHLLETLLKKISAYEEDTKAEKDMMTPQSMLNGDVLTPHPSNAPTSIQEATPYMSLFDNPVLGHREPVAPSQVSTPRSQQCSTKPSGCSKISRVERIRQTLVDLLPSQHDADLISKSTSCYMIVHAMSRHNADTFLEASISETTKAMSSTFNMAEVAKKSPSAIARSLMYLVICLQQLDPDLDKSRLHLLPTIESRMERWMSTIQALVTSDDELITTMEGLECLTLQGVYHMNCGSLRRSWLASRRALSTAQLMGIHRTNTDIPGGREFWHQIVQIDRYLALILGLPAGSKFDDFGPDEVFSNPSVNKDKLFMRKLCHLSTYIIDRNQSQQPVAYASTQEIDDKLDSLAKEMPESWWEIPLFRPVINGYQTEQGVADFDRIVMQIWYFQLGVLAHLPFMLRAATERRYEYSKFSCLKAAREMIYRYLSMTADVQRAICCKVMDFAALTSTVTLLLGILQVVQGAETPEANAQKESDRRLVKAVLKQLENATDGGRDVISTQSVTVIKSLVAMDSPNAPKESGNLRLTIPYFGTISIVRPKTDTSPKPDRRIKLPAIVTGSSDVSFASTPASQSGDWNAMAYSTPPEDLQQQMISFTSSHFAPGQHDLTGIHPFTEWNLSEADTQYFDTLLSTDVNGNWII